MRDPFTSGLGVALTVFATSAFASCGSAFCTLMTDRFAQGTGDAHLGWSADLRLESVSQTQLRSGTHNIDPSQVTGEDAIERRTTSRSLVTTLGYGLDADWSLSLRVPIVRRDHEHDLIDDTTGLPSTPQRWRFTKLGGRGTVRHAALGAELPPGKPRHPPVCRCSRNRERNHPNTSVASPADAKAVGAAYRGKACVRGVRIRPDHDFVCKTRS